MNGPVIQGWCPGALRPMLSGDGLVVRVRPRGGRLTPEQARGIAQLAALHGNGLIDLSARANVQVRGVTDASHPALIDGLRDLGLIDTGTEAEARRNITVAPFWTEGDSTSAITSALAEALTADDAPVLSGKFGFAVDLGAVPVLRATSADIRIERGPDGLLLCAAGAPLAKRVTTASVVQEALDLAQWFIAQGGVTEGRGRMQGLLARLPLPQPFDTPRLLVSGKTPLPGLRPLGCLVGFDFGQMQAETLAALADLGALRVTPWRMLLIEGARQIPDLPGLITNPCDPMLRVIACTGAPGCLQAFAVTRPLARALAPHLSQTLHVSGCTKGCAHPGAAALTLTATSDGFALIRDGVASGTPCRSGLSADDLIQNPALLTEFP